ncbi:MAG: type II secretion system F family protein [Candidatus Omnitrophica bacterium]|nr:type II secretion system F family protein [Candidatus Omnitrophota bacterium]
MPSFKYLAKDKDGKTISGTTDAASREELINILREKELIIIDITEVGQGTRASTLSFFKERVNADDLVIFSRQLATMVSSGIPLVNAFDILGEQIEKKRFKEIVLDVRDEIEAGKSLSAGLAKHSDVFSNLFVNMVKAGESSGMLDEILDRVALYLEKTSALQKKIKSAMVYPVIITIMALSVTALLLIKVIPIFKEIYAGFGAKLPLPTQMLISASDFMRKYFLQGVIALSVIIFFTTRLAKTPKGRLFLDTRKLKLPVFGPMLRKIIVGRFTRTLSTLVKSGVSILVCLEIVAKTAGNKVIENAVLEVHSSIREGETIASPLQKSGVFPPMVVRMISVGERTGQLDKMLSKISDFYDEQVEAAISGLTSIIEPLIIAFLGIVIGTIVICMFLPIFKLSTLMAV